MRALLIVSALWVCGTASAQIQRPSASPRSILQQRVGLVDVTVDYGRPGVKGRTIFGELEPYGRVWRTGANASTKITFSGDVVIDKKEVPAGTYGLYTIPQRKQWTIILSKNSKLWGAGGYQESDDLIRVEVKPKKLKQVCETLTIDFERHHPNGADLSISWDKIKVVLPIFVDSDQQVLAEIERKLKEPVASIKAATWFDAGMFYYEKSLDLKQAESWIGKAVQASPNAFWYLYYHAEVAFARKQHSDARSRAEAALAKANASTSDFGYIAKSKLLLAKIKRESRGRGSKSRPRR